MIVERTRSGESPSSVAAPSEYNPMSANAGTRHDRYTRSEVKFITTISIGETQKRVDELAKTHRELDVRIQELNWKTELVD